MNIWETDGLPRERRLIIRELEQAWFILKQARDKIGSTTLPDSMETTIQDWLSDMMADVAHQAKIERDKE